MVANQMPPGTKKELHVMVKFVKVAGGTGEGPALLNPMLCARLKSSRSLPVCSGEIANTQWRRSMAGPALLARKRGRMLPSPQRDSGGCHGGGGLWWCP